VAAFVHTGDFYCTKCISLPAMSPRRYLMSRPANVARALRIEPLRLQRLVFLSRQGMAGSINLRNALTLSGCKFVSLYPRYPAWLAQVYSSGNPPKRYAAAAAVDTDDEDSEDDSNY